MLQSTKLKRVGDVKSTLTSDMKLQNLEFAQLAFSLSLVQYFLAMLLFLNFGIIMHIPYNFIL